MRAFSKWTFVGLLSLAASPAFAAQCQPPGGFPAFLESFKQEAKAAGIGSRGLSALNGLKLDTATLAYDKKVRSSFKGSFAQFAATRVTSGRVNRAAAYLKSHAPLFQRIEAQFGVPGPILSARNVSRVMRRTFGRACSACRQPRRRPQRLKTTNRRSTTRKLLRPMAESNGGD